MDLSCVVLDVMQVEVTRTYTAKQPDELSLQVTDVVLVSQTVEDGMFFFFVFSLSLARARSLPPNLFQLHPFHHALV